MTLTTWWISQSNTERIENLYFKGFYSFYRKIWAVISFGSPMPLFYLWIASILIFLVWVIFDRVNKQKSTLYLFYRICIFGVLHLIWFYWAWGFNYGREDLKTRWQLHSNLDQTEFTDEFISVSRKCDTLSKSASFTFTEIELEDHIRKLVLDFHSANGFIAFEKVRCRQLQPSGLLLMWATAGIYLPFTGEAQIDKGLHNLQKPFTMAHEFCHLMGWTDEGECNFLAYLICNTSENTFIRYSAEITYWRYLAGNARKFDAALYQKVYVDLSPEFKYDLDAIHTQLERFPLLFPEWREKMYDWYLRKNGVVSGAASYSEIIGLLVNYKNKHKG